MRPVPASAVVIGLVAVLVVLAQAQQPPAFKAGVSFVHVDVYPRSNGRIVDDLRQDELEVFEDGVRQTIETFEHVRPRLPGTQSERAEPGNVRESDEAASDPHTRLFVVFFDTLHMFGYHGSEGEAQTEDTKDRPAFSFAPRANWYDPRTAGRAVSAFVRQLVGGDDLIAVTTPETPVQKLLFTRRPSSLDGFLESGGEWEKRFLEGYSEDIERQYVACYPPEVGKSSGIAATMIARRREMRVLDSLHELVTHLQDLRETRKAVILVSEGWTLFTPAAGLGRSTIGSPGQGPEGPMGGVRPPGSQVQAGDDLWLRCAADLSMLLSLDNERTFAQLLGDAGRANVTFYPVDPQGLPARPERRRLNSLQSLADETDGFVIGNSNDVRPGLERIRDDVSSYYLLGYNSTNRKFDGRFRKITVRVKRPGVAVRARRGYLAPAEADVKALARTPSRPDPDTALREAALSLLGLERPGAAVHVAAGYAFSDAGAGSRQLLWIVGELEARAARTVEWSRGGKATVTVGPVGGGPIVTEHVVITPTARQFTLRLAQPTLGPGDYVVRVLLANDPDGQVEVLDQVNVTLPDMGSASRRVFGVPMLYRRAGYAGAEFQPTADRRFRRTERLRVNVPLGGAVGDPRALLLDRNGHPLAIPVTVSLREGSAERFLAADASLTALAPADYLVQVEIRNGAAVEKALAAFRIVP